MQKSNKSIICEFYWSWLIIFYELASIEDMAQMICLLINFPKTNAKAEIFAATK
jgi:hypothetical protein